MNEPESDPQSGSGVAALEEKYAELSRVTNLLFAALVVISFTFTAYLGLMGRRAAADAAAAKQRADQAMRVVQQDETAIQGFYLKLEEFGHNHPDFQNRVVSKFKVTGTNSATAGK